MSNPNPAANALEYYDLATGTVIDTPLDCWHLTDPNADLPFNKVKYKCSGPKCYVLHDPASDWYAGAVAEPLLFVMLIVGQIPPWITWVIGAIWILFPDPNEMAQIKKREGQGEQETGGEVEHGSYLRGEEEGGRGPLRVFESRRESASVN